MTTLSKGETEARRGLSNQSINMLCNPVLDLKPGLVFSTQNNVHGLL